MGKRLPYRNYRKIAGLMLASLLILVIFIVQWLRMQYVQQKSMLDESLDNLLVQAHSDVKDSLISSTISVLMSMDTTLPVTVADNAAMQQRVLNAIPANVLKQSNIVFKKSIKPLGMEEYSSQLQLSISADSMDDKLLGILGKTIESIQAVKLLAVDREQNKALFQRIKVPFQQYLKSKYPAISVDDSKTGNALRFESKQMPGLQLYIGNARGYLYGKMLPPVLFSLFLLLITATAFAWSLRSLRKQILFNEQKNSFINNVSHELKTPVATARIALEALSTYNAIEDKEKATRYIQVAGWEMERLSVMISRFMDILKADTRNIELHKENVRLSALLDQITESLELLITQKNIRLLTHNTDDAICLKADKIQLLNALYNIVDNAIKYGGDTIEITSSRDTDNGICTIAVMDNGKGIDDVYKTRIFEAFFRINNGDVHDVKGHGLGLSYARYIIERHGGKVYLDSSAAYATVFKIVLPLF